eukprot:Gb_08512 [translate_table: standard]
MYASTKGRNIDHPPNNRQLEINLYIIVDVRMLNLKIDTWMNVEVQCVSVNGNPVELMKSSMSTGNLLVENNSRNNAVALNKLDHQRNSLRQSSSLVGLLAQLSMDMNRLEIVDKLNMHMGHSLGGCLDRWSLGLSQTNETVAEVAFSCRYMENVTLSSVKMVIGIIIIGITLAAQSCPNDCNGLRVLFNDLLQFITYAKEKNTIIFTNPLPKSRP